MFLALACNCRFHRLKTKTGTDGGGGGATEYLENVVVGGENDQEVLLVESVDLEAHHWDVVVVPQPMPEILSGHQMSRHPPPPPQLRPM
jgi:hypothetical protein